MKKIVVLLLVLTMTVMLAACGENPYAKYDALIGYIEDGNADAAQAELDGLLADANNDPSDEKEPKTTVIDITVDNWQDYLVIEQTVRADKNAFDEVTSAFVGYRLVAKDAWKDKITDAEIAIEFEKSDKQGAHFAYNTKTEELISDEAITEQELKDNNWWFDKDEVDKGTATIDEYGLRDGRTLGSSYGAWESSKQTDGDLFKWAGTYFAKIELTRVQGTITVTE